MGILPMSGARKQTHGRDDRSTADSQTLPAITNRAQTNTRDGFPVSRIRSPVSLRVVRIHNGHLRLRFDRRLVAAVIHQLDANATKILNLGPSPARLHPVPPGELSIAFLTDSALARLHALFLDDPSPTDVITFAGTPALGQAGEICVSADTARAFAAGHRRDFCEELTLYVVHGWLHLAGHDDRQPASKKRMRAAEARALALLRTRRMIPPFTFAG
jgi:probable rRNA maturation factor